MQNARDKSLAAHDGHLSNWQPRRNSTAESLESEIPKLTRVRKAEVIFRLAAVVSLISSNVTLA
jgi:hypothetical protein